MNELQIFNSPEFGKIRALEIDGEPWLVGKDVVDILGYRNGSRDINRHVDEDDRQKAMVFDGNQNKETIIINESGLYSLISPASSLEQRNSSGGSHRKFFLPSARRAATSRQMERTIKRSWPAPC